MNEFEFTCPTCGQTIVAESSDCGQQTTCPRCQSALVVPASSQANTPAPLSPPAAQRTSGLAIASLICGLVVCLGSIPGIICGHMARRRIQRNPALKGMGIANAGLLISYLSLVINGGILGSCAYRTVTGTRQAWQDAQRQITLQMQTNRVVKTVPTEKPTEPPAAAEPSVLEEPDTNETVSAAPASPVAAPAQPTHSPKAPAPPAPSARASAPGSGWTLDLQQADIPDQRPTGRFRGARFVARRIRLLNSGLHLASADGSTYNISLGVKKDEILSGSSYVVQPSDTTPACKVSLDWKEDGNPTMQRVLKGYALKLQFGQISDYHLPGKIYLCLPDAQKSYVAGSFTVSAKD